MSLDSFSRTLRRRKYSPIPRQGSSFSPSHAPFHVAASPAASSPPHRLSGQRNWRLCFRSGIRGRLSSKLTFLWGDCIGEPEFVLGFRRNAASRHGGLALAPAVVVEEIVPEGPISELSEEELHRRECINLLRKLAASGSVRGLVY